MGAREMVNQTLITRLRDACERYGDQTALSFKPGFRFRRWTYSELWQDVGRASILFKRKGLQPGDRVLIWAPNSPQWAISYFATMMAGGIVVAMDLRVSDEFVDRVVGQTDPVLSIVSGITPPAHTDLSAESIYLEELETDLAELDSQAGTPDESIELAEIMFTSGTTGDPKGVMLSHANLLAAADAASDVIPVGPTDRLLSILPLSHVFEQTGGLLLPLLNGAGVTFITTRQPTALLKLMQEVRPTTILMVPLLLDIFMKGIERQVEQQGKQRLWNTLMAIAARLPFRARRLLFRSVLKKMGGKLNFVVSGGAALPPELGRKWELMGVKILQGYGTTETAPTITINTLTDRKIDSAGKPLRGVDVRLENGEIQVRGPNVTAGYWQNEQATAEAFEDGWYKTGDIGEFDDEGFLHIRGRIKEMIVHPNGLNVFPEDVEAALKKDKRLGEVCVIGLESDSGVEVHAVFLPADAEHAADAVADANQALAPHQQIRGHSVWDEDGFPLTHSLKVRKNVIAHRLSGANDEAPTPPDIPGGAEADDLASLVARVAQVPTSKLRAETALGVDLGIDSLGRVELLSAIEEQFGVFIDEEAIEAETTVAELGFLVDAGSGEKKDFNSHAWGTNPLICMIRGVLQRSTIFPLLRWAYKVDVVGKQNLAGARGQVIFAANHTLSLDAGVILKAMPNRQRKRLAVASGAHMWSNPLQAITIPLFGNGFAFSRDGNVRASLENTGRIMDDGWSVLIFPEGERSDDGEMRPFLAGTGLLAVEARLPVVPIRVDVEKKGRPGAIPVLRRGHLTIRFGEPISFGPATPYDEAVRTIESAVRAL